MSPPDPGVLVVEDDVDIRESVVELLQEHGFHALGAEHGAEALSILRAGARPGLLIVDLAMPVMDGATLCARLAEEPALASIPVVLVSAYRNVAAAIESIQPAAFLAKPLDARLLLTTVRDHVRSS